MQIKFSIITVCYNAHDCIKNTVESVLGQNYENYEYIIIDGKSTDDTVDIIKKTCNNHKVNIVCEPDKGIYDAMNKGIRLAKGDLITFLNAGDVFYNNEVLNNTAKLADLSNAVVFGDIVVKKYGVQAREIAKLSIGKGDLQMGFNHQGTFVKREIAQSFLFNLNYRVAADYDMMLRIYKNGYSFQKINVIIAYYDMNGFSVKQNKQHYKERALATYGDTLYCKFLYAKRVFMLTLRSWGRQLFPSLTNKIEFSMFLKNKQLIQE